MSQENTQDIYFLSAVFHLKGVPISHGHFIYKTDAGSDPSDALKVASDMLLDRFCTANDYNPKALVTQVVAFNRV